MPHAKLLQVWFFSTRLSLRFNWNMSWVGLKIDDVWCGLDHDMEELESKEFCFLEKNFKEWYIYILNHLRNDSHHSLCYWVRMWENTDQKKLRIWTIFTQCQFHVRFPYLTSFHLYLVYSCSLPLLFKTASTM